jgi:hypothetical protein
MYIYSDEINLNEPNSHVKVIVTSTGEKCSL